VNRLKDEGKKVIQPISCSVKAE